jgi:hypothetical protein
MSQRTLISFYQKKQKRDKDRISSLLSGRSSFTKAKKRTSAQAVFTPAAESTSAASTSAASTSATRGETEMEDVLILGEERQTSPSSQARKRRRTEIGREDQHSDGNFSKIFILKYLIKIFYNV